MVQPFTLVSDYVNTTKGKGVTFERRGNLHLSAFLANDLGSKALFRMRQQALDMNVNRIEFVLMLLSSQIAPSSLFLRKWSGNKPL